MKFQQSRALLAANNQDLYPLTKTKIVNVNLIYPPSSTDTTTSAQTTAVPTTAVPTTTAQVTTAEDSTSTETTTSAKDKQQFRLQQCQQQLLK